MVLVIIKVISKVNPVTIYPVAPLVSLGNGKKKQGMMGVFKI
jgi:hypothetical protein